MVLHLLAAALAAPAVLTSEAIDGPAHKRVAVDQADLVVLYGGEQDGSQDPCGCPSRPRGSLGRVEAYAAVVREQGVPTLLVNPGNWLRDTIGDDDRLSDDARAANAQMLEAIEAGTWDALNVSFRDLPYLGEIASFPPDAVLSNARGPGGPPDHRLLPVGDRTVAIVGVTGWSKEYLQPPAFERADPVDALAALLPSLREQADLVIVLGYALGARAKAIAELDIDVLIDADTHRGRFEPIVVDDAVWVRSNFGTQRLGELRLRLGDDGRIASAHDRMIDLDASIKMDRAWKKRADRARREIESAREAAWGAAGR